MGRLWQTVKGYIFWTYERGSFHYDVMVTIILLFIFLTPRSVFRDKPVGHNPHQTEVVVQPDGPKGFIYEVDASAVAGGSDAAIRESLLSVIEPIANQSVEITSYEPIRDRKGKITAYRVRVQR